MINIDVIFGGLNSTAPPASKASQLSSLSAQSFKTFLSEALSETLSKFGIDPNSFQLTLTNQPSQTPATSQSSAANPSPVSAPAASLPSPVIASAIPVTISQTPGPGLPAAPSIPAAITPAAVAPPVAAAISPALVVPPPADPAVAAPALPSGRSGTWYASNPADDAYWSVQPSAVQQLRGIDSLDERKALGEKLASEGYNIDVPIMIWGWDAAKVTAARESYGYTWVPSALQQQVSAAPGVTGGGFTPYNPNHPPAGSIQV